MDEEKRTGSPVPEDPSQDSDYQFLNQVIRKKKTDKQALLLRVAGLLLGAILFGTLAAIMFVITVPHIAGVLNVDLGTPKISIPPDEESVAPDEESIATDSIAEVFSSGSIEPETESAAESESSVFPEEKQDTAQLSGSGTDNEAREQGEAEGQSAVQEQGTAIESAADREPETSADAAADPGQEAAADAAADSEAVQPSDSREDRRAGNSTGQAEKQDAAVPPDSDLPEEPAETDGDGKTRADPAEQQNPVQEPALSLGSYRELYKDMLKVADDSEHALVQVTGITSEMDYFNHNYENRRQIAGLAIAENEESLYVLTEYRVVENVERILVTFYDGTMADANFQKQDPNTGLTILKVRLDSIAGTTRKHLQMAPLGNSFAVNRGEPVLALGNPSGYSDSVAYGVVTSTSNFVSGTDAQYPLLMTDIEGSRDGSGILINLDGKVIGIISQQYGGSAGNTITALSISKIKPLIEKLSNNEVLQYIGITGQNVTQELTDRTGIPKGVLVTAVEPDSPAMLAGIKEYDVLIRIENSAITRVKDYQDYVGRMEEGETYMFTAMRKGAEGYSEISFDVECGSH